MLRSLLTGLALGFIGTSAWGSSSVPIPVEAFFSNYQVSSVQVSPDGKYLALVAADNATGELDKYINIVNADDLKIKTSFKVSDDKAIWYYWWAGDDRVLVATTTQTGAISVPSFDGALYAVNLDGSQSQQLLGVIPDNTPAAKAPIQTTDDNFTHVIHKDAESAPAKRTNYYFDGMLYIPRDASHHVLVEGWAFGAKHTQVLDVDIYTGDVKVVVESPLTNGSFLTDADGHVRLAWGIHDFDGKPQLFYRDAADGADWKDISVLYADHDPADEDAGPLRMAQDGRTFYWRGRTPDSTLGLFRIDPKDMSKKTVFADPIFDISMFIYGDFAGNHYDVLGVETEPGLPVFHVIDEKDPETALLQALQQAFPGQSVYITSSTRDGGSVVLFVSSDRNPGDYYLFNTKTLKAEWLYSRLDKIDPDKMAARLSVSLKTRDGLTLYGYLTVPQGKSRTDLPLILLPHGGPHNVHDHWGWDPEAEFFASRGYAVLQVNYRGSGGYGLKFQALGYQNWGTTMQDDLADAVEWAVKQGIADPKRVCIYGASYGGYAALENPIRYPQLYKCAVGYAGVYDLTLEAKYGDVHRSKYGRNFLEAVNGNDKAALKRYSPAFNADKITVPVFIAYGGKDQRVVPDNAKELTAAMDAAGKKYEILFDPYEIHGFGKPEDKYELYTRMIKFIDANIGDAAANPGASAESKPITP
jgi:dipeptidyl aminopeptidase/acylaminoacyl peptidase